MTNHQVVSHDEWTEARKTLLTEEKAMTRQQDELSRKQRALPWEKVEEKYIFDTPQGKKTLAQLFDGRSQLVVYHFMLGPNWEEGCPSCSYLADHFDGIPPHINQRDATFMVVSHAPLAKIQEFKQRMGWRFPWVSSYGTNFNHDYQVSFTKEDRVDGKVYYNYVMQEFPSDEAPGLSIFYRDAAGNVFHTYSTYGRGLDQLVGTYTLLDLVPKGRDEGGLQNTMSWVKHHDKYVDNRPVELRTQFAKVEESHASCKTEEAQA